MGHLKTAVHLKSPGSYFEDWKLSSNQLCGERDIRITDPCVKYPLKPHFYIVKLGFTGIYIISHFCSNTYIMVTR